MSPFILVQSPASSKPEHYTYTSYDGCSPISIQDPVSVIGGTHSFVSFRKASDVKVRILCVFVRLLTGLSQGGTLWKFDLSMMSPCLRKLQSPIIKAFLKNFFTQQPVDTKKCKIFVLGWMMNELEKSVFGWKWFTLGLSVNRSCCLYLL